MNDWLDDVRGLISIQLNDELPKIRLKALDAVFNEKRVEVDLLRRHRLGLRELGNPVLTKNRKNRLARILIRRCIMDIHSACGERFLRFRKVFTEVVQCVILDGCRQLADRIRIRIILVKRMVALLSALRRTIDDRSLLLVGDVAGVLIDWLNADHKSEFLRT